MPVDVAELWRRTLRVAGIDALYGKRCAPLNVTPVPDAVAGLFALAHQRVHGARAGTSVGKGTFRFPGRQPAQPVTLEITRAAGVVDVLPMLAAGDEVEVRLVLSLSHPADDIMPVAPPGAAGWVEPADEVVAAIGRSGTVSILVGPGVVRSGAVPGLHDLAVRGSAGVLNTWGAKGVFHWQSRHHLATVGLQEDDFRLGGLDQVDLIVASGLDPHEAPDERWQLAPWFELAPEALGPLAERCPSRGGDIAMPPLRSRLAAVTQRGWSVARGPLPPTRVTMHYAELVASGGLVAADAGTAGYWVARTLGTTRLGGVIVPPSRQPGLAAACVAVSLLRRPDRPALAVVDGGHDEVGAAVLDAARSLGLGVPVESWDPAGPTLDADDHRDRLGRLTGGPASEPVTPQSLATDPTQMADMLDAAGPIVAWT